MKMHIRLEGLEDVQRLLKEIAPNQANNIMRATVFDMAKQIAADAREGMPVDEGLMRKETKHKRERSRPGFHNSSVGVTRKAFYWRFLEYGDGPDSIAYDFFLRAAERMRATMMGTFLRSFGAKFEKAAERAGRKLK